jgi:divalent metal cation (Fe/Co/Zn/Cd) transporter
LKKAYANMSAQIDEQGWSGLREAFRKTSDVTVLTALTEDAIAMAGAGLALFGIWLSRFTGNPLYDAVAAFLIGLMLMGFAVALAWENKRLLLGESLPKSREDALRDLIRSRAGVTGIADFRTVYFGPEDVLLAADITFESGADTERIDAKIDDLERAIRAANPDVSRIYLEPH